MHLACLAARTVIGGLFIGHGTQKLMGWFGGPGLEGTDQMMDGLRMHPPRRNALAAGVSEAAGGTLLAAGLATPLAAASLIGVMTTAIRTVHAPNGVWNSDGGYEFNLTLIAALATIVEAGPGALSLDHALGIEKKGTAIALGTTALGVAASFATVELGRREAERTARLHPAAPADSAAQ